MVSKDQGSYTKDNSKYGDLTDGSGNLVVTSVTPGSTKQTTGSQAPDGSIYFTLTDGQGNLV